METTVTVLISGVVLGAVQVCKQFAWCQGGISLAISILLSLVITLLYAFSHETAYQPIMLWNYTTAFISIAGTAVGIHSAAKNTTEIVKSRMGTGSGE